MRRSSPTRTYRCVYDGTTVEIGHRDVPRELQMLIDRLVDLIAAHEPPA